MKPTRLTLDTVAVPIAGGREFTAALYRAPEGEPCSGCGEPCEECLGHPEQEARG